MAPSNHPTYHKEEKVFCFHHEILYEAKILEVKLSDPDDKKSPYEYRVHYKGWKNTYVPCSYCSFVGVDKSHNPWNQLLTLCETLFLSRGFRGAPAHVLKCVQECIPDL